MSGASEISQTKAEIYVTQQALKKPLYIRVFKSVFGGGGTAIPTPPFLRFCRVTFKEGGTIENGENERIVTQYQDGR